MAKAYIKNKEFHSAVDLERQLVLKLSKTGSDEVKRRKKAGLSSFFIKNGRIVERLPDNTEHIREAVHSRWVKVDQRKRSFKLK